MRIRLAMQSETFIGPKGRSQNRRPEEITTPRGNKGPGTGKVTGLGMRERDGKVRAWVVRDQKRGTLLPRVWDHVAKGSTVYTNSLGSYHSLKHDYVHHVINHAEKYVDGKVHTNSIENFWSVLKRTIGGTYFCPRPKHLDAYLDEQIFRYNERGNQDGPRFYLAAKGADGKHMTYRQLKARNSP